MFYFADMPWYERQAASLLFASPPQSSYEAALEQFLKAEALEPGFYKKNAQMIASTYARLGKQAEAKEWKAKALAMPTKTLDDEEAHSQALKL
jgi:regulator of microtubule dynamics protein 3